MAESEVLRAMLTTVPPSKLLPAMPLVVDQIMGFSKRVKSQLASTGSQRRIGPCLNK
jgi:hypothetical protein